MIENDLRTRIQRKYRSLLRTKINKKNKERLNNSQFSIISSNCVGGVIAHELGQRFLSPTVNLFLVPEDYIKFIYNLKFYIKESDMIEDQIESLKRGYPVGKLDDIKLFFVHYKNFDSAKNKWYERCSRINWNNIYFIMTQRDGCTEKEIKQFEKYPSHHKVIFVSQPRSDIKCSYYIQNSSVNNEVIDLNLYKGKLTGKRWIDEFDYVSFLNNNE